ncbi:MAG: hypothetical protein ACK553_01600 [Planctomycetota bacterium]|jgi:hypothetical protein
MIRSQKPSVCQWLWCASSIAILCTVVSVRSIADERDIARSLLDQLDDRRFSERKAAFLKLCDPHWDIDAWLDEQASVSDPNRSTLAQWIRRLRGIPGSMDERLEMMADYQSLMEGDVSVVSKYIDNRRISMLAILLELLPESARENLSRYPSGDSPFDQVISAAWRDGTEKTIPRLLNAILPKHPIRVGLNARWKEIGMPPEWRVDVPSGIPEVEIATLEQNGKVDEALAIAKRNRLKDEYEKLLLRHQRWEEWLKLDPLQKGTAATGWEDVQRILLLESLGRHDEAMVFYELRKSDKSKAKSYYNQQKALMALLVGDKPAFNELIQTEAPTAWMDILFLHSELDKLLEAEGLSELSIKATDRWFDKWARQGGPINKPIRFQSLFHRLGLKEMEENLNRRIRRHIKAGSDEQSLQEWDGILNEWGKYGLDDRRLEAIAELVSRRETDRSSTDLLLTPRGEQPAQVDTRAVKLETIFFKNFPNIRFAALSLHDTLRKQFPDLDAPARIAIVEDLNQGRMPKGWTEKELMSAIRDMIRSALNEPSVLEPMLVDIADVLDTLGLTDEALKLLQNQAESHAANLLIAQYAAKLGQYDDAARLSLQLVDRHRDDVNAHLLASQCLADARRFDNWLSLQQQSLSRMDSWEWAEQFFQSMRRTQRMEPQPEILFMLELLQRHTPSTWHELWYGNAYTQYGARIQADWYHRSIAQHPERIPELQHLQIQNAFEEIRLRSRSQFPDQGGGGTTGLADVDWSLWSMQYERVYAASFWRAVQEGNLDLANRLIRTAHQVYPEQINTLIDVAPLVRSQFGETTLKEWYELYAGPLRAHLERFPDDSLIANNTAWLAAKCGLELELAFQLASRVVEQRPTDTYLDTLAEVEFALGNTANAIEISERCRSMKPRDPHHARQLERFRKAARESAKPAE